MQMARSWAGFGDDKPLWKERRCHLVQFPDHKATEKENSSKNLRKSKEKERAKNQAVTPAPPQGCPCSSDSDSCFFFGAFGGFEDFPPPVNLI